ncbi:zinc-dependent peptidase, partial [Pseudomonas syringae]
MGSCSRGGRVRALARRPDAEDLWQNVCARLPILDGLSSEQHAQLRDACVLFLHAKHLSALPGVDLDDEQRLFLAAQAQLPLLNLGELNWYQGFHDIVLYPDDFVSPPRPRHASGAHHDGDG